jgi:nicotinamidase-related amidase
MSMIQYSRENSAVLLVDPYNDMLSEGGLVWPRLREVAAEVGLLDNLRAIHKAARAAGVRIFIVPHHRWEESDYAGWQHLNPSQERTRRNRTFARGAWGGEFHPDFVPGDGDVVVQEHWAQSGFANTDLDMQLKQHGISHVILMGLIANTCVESTARFAMELGYHVTLVSDATAAASREAMRATHEVNGPTFAHAILTTRELISALPKGLV